jgi:hypothetical protein
MARRISIGVQGRSILGNFVATTNIFQTRELNQDLVLDPSGAGKILIEGDLKISGSQNLILESSDNKEITINTTNISQPYTVTLPATPPATNGHTLLVTTSGQLSFAAINLPVQNQTADSATYYPLMNTATSGNITGLSVSSTKLNFQPSTGILSVTEVRTTGNVTAFSSSDRSLKENIRPIENALDKIEKINGVRYDWTDDYIESRGGEDGYFVRKKDVGLIAQEVEEVLPEIVAENGDGHKAIKYERVIALCVEAIKELKRDIEKLRKD